ncbi:MAG: sodium:solute symporter family protein [Ignavibacteriales bacterium]|nr:sodium:solute symporter family protein [Ignavibacteriales bacterium]MCB9219663.1 sodium:solute symporter family protein [Ignavibacteriales bacterium]
MNLTIVDIILIAIYLILIFFSGTLVKKYIKGIDNFLVAGRSMGFHLGLLSLMCTEIGMITYVYYAELGYKAGLAALIVAFPPVIAYIFLGRTGFIIKPLLEMKISTIPEFFSRKFSKGVRFYIGIIMAIGGILNFGVFPGVEANFINIVTGIPKEYLLLTMVVMLTLVLIYTVVGGMVSVIVTNYIQYILLSFGMLFITVFGILYVGWDNIVNSATTELGEKGINPFTPTILEGEFGIGFIVWQILLWIALLVGWQAISMRLFSSKDSKIGQKIYTWSGLMFLSRGIMPILWGVIALTAIGKGIDSLEALPLLLVKIVPSGLLGIIFAALLAASMSTYASYLLSWSSVVSQDIIGSIVGYLTKKEMDSKTQLLVSRITMAAVMLFIIWWSLFHEMEGYLYFYLNMTGMLFIPGVLICVTFGIYWNKSRTLGAYLAITFGAILPMLYLIWPNEVQEYASEIGWGGFVVSLLGMLIGSAIQNIFQPKLVGEK